MKSDNHRPPITPVNVSISEQVFKRADLAVCIHKCITLIPLNDERFKHETVHNMWLNQEKRVETDSEEETASCVHAQFILRLHGSGRPTCCFVLTQMCMAAHEYL